MPGAPIHFQKPDRTSEPPNQTRTSGLRRVRGAAIRFTISNTGSPKGDRGLAQGRRTDLGFEKTQVKPTLAKQGIDKNLAHQAPGHAARFTHALAPIAPVSGIRGEADFLAPRRKGQSPSPIRYGVRGPCSPWLAGRLEALSARAGSFKLRGS
jgi:predicted GNAT family acetyltransferase